MTPCRQAGPQLQLQIPSHKQNAKLITQLQSYAKRLGHPFFRQSRSQSPLSSVRGIVGLWEKAQKNARNSLHSITIGSSTLGKRAIFKLLNDGALARS